MTAIVGILCTDGIIVGTDGSGTLSTGTQSTIEQPVEKLFIINNRAILAGTGQVGLGQRFQVVVDRCLKDPQYNALSAIDFARLLSKTTIEDYASTYAPKGQYGAIVAYESQNTLHLCEFAVADFQPELKTSDAWFVSMGCTQMITDSLLAFLRDIYCRTRQPRISEGIFIATWALDHAIAVNTGGVKDPVSMAILTKEHGTLKAISFKEGDLAEHRQNIEAAKKALREHADHIYKITEKIEIPKPP